MKMSDRRGARWALRGLSWMTAVAGIVLLQLNPLAAEAARPAPPAPAFGVAIAGAPNDLTALTSLTNSLGTAPKLVSWYSHWAYDADFPSAGAAKVAATGAVPEITWEPWDPAAGVNQPAYSLDRIAAGAFDAFLTRWARAIRAYKGPVVLRFAHEMNGNWYPWSEGVNGNGPGDYVAAWRHVRYIFTTEQATNVTWKWSPNVPYYGSTPLAALYPGDAYVDQVALDGYNWSTLYPWSSWTSFWDIFRAGAAEIATITSKPLYIGEMGCPEVGGDKAAWVDDMFATLRAHPEIRGFTWFNFLKETDWRIESSPASLDSFRRGLGTQARS